MILLCLKIFFARIIDVSIGTVRTIIMVKGKTNVAALLSFFEVLIWFLVVKEAISTSVSSIFVAIFYSLGYATGTFIGGYITNNLIDSYVGIELIIKGSISKVVTDLKKHGYGASTIPLNNNKNYHEMIYIQTKNSKLNKLKEIINKYDDKAFMIVNETKYINNGFLK